MRQRDVEALITRYGNERGTVHVIMRLAEEQEAMLNTIKEMANAFAQMATVLTMQNAVSDGMKEKIDAMGRHFDTDPRSTHAAVRSVDRWEDNDE